MTGRANTRFVPTKLGHAGAGCRARTLCSPSTPQTARRASCKMFSAAFVSRSKAAPQAQHRCRRSDSVLGATNPHPEQRRLVLAGLTWTTFLPTPSALRVRTSRNKDQAASEMDFDRQWFRTMFRITSASTAISP